MCSKYILLLFIFGLTIFASSQNVPPTISDPEQLETIRKERQLIFDQLIEEPTNQSNLFKYANLSIILGDLEAAIGVFEQMLIYKPDLPRIKLELGVLYFRLGEYASAKRYLDDVEKSRLSEFEEKFYDFLDASCGDLLNTIKSSGQLDDSTEETLKTKITDFVKGF